MSTIERPVSVYETPRTERKGNILASWLSSTDHKIIGHLYLITSFFFFLCAGVMALLIRIQLLGPNEHVVSDQQYNELFTMKAGRRRRIPTATTASRTRKMASGQVSASGR